MQPKRFYTKVKNILEEVYPFLPEEQTVYLAEQVTEIIETRSELITTAALIAAELYCGDLTMDEIEYFYPIAEDPEAYEKLLEMKDKVQGAYVYSESKH